MLKNNNPLTNCPILAITLGEPAGIGPDIFLTISQFSQVAHLIVFGSAELLLARAKSLGMSIRLNFIEDLKHYIALPSSRLPSKALEINIVPIPLKHPVQPGQLSVDNSAYVLACLKQATDACLQHYCDAMTTGPVHKDILRQYDEIFIDQTHFISAQCQVDYQRVMMGFVSPGMRLGLATLHEPIHQVSSLLTPEFVQYAIHSFAQNLSAFFHIDHPKIGILGFNPHAGENGLIGQEEQAVLLPCIQALNQSNPHYTLSSLLSPDSAFISANRAQYDGFLAWYHDQGLTPFKTLYEQNAATLLFGLPIIRTSVDHGTALSLAGTNKADARSFDFAIRLATTIVNNKQ
jgi:4-hydroxythreonine-4-phosphate dehydrogenase